MVYCKTAWNYKTSWDDFEHENNSGTTRRQEPSKADYLFIYFSNRQGKFFIVNFLKIFSAPIAPDEILGLNGFFEYSS